MKEINMKKLISLIAIGIVLSTALSGCIVVPVGGGGYYHHHDYYNGR